MDLARLGGRSRYALVAISLLGLYAASQVGCIIPGLDPNTIASAGNRAPDLTITAPTIDTTVRRGESIIVVYQVSDLNLNQVTMSFYVDVDNTLNGNEILVGTQTPPGSSYTMNTTSVPPGNYYILVVADNGGGGVTRRYTTVNLLHVLNPLQVTFQQPIGEVRAGIGDTITITFSFNDLYNYFLFYDTDLTYQGNERAITPVTPATGQTTRTETWNLSNVPAGTFYVGARVVDNLGRSYTFYAPATIIVYALPTVQVLDPSSNMAVWETDSIKVRRYNPITGEPNITNPADPNQFMVRFMVTEPNTQGPTRVTIFLDPNQSSSGDERVIVTGPLESLDPTLAFRPVDIAGVTPGVDPLRYYVGVTAVDDSNQPVTRYSAGLVTVYSSDPNNAGVAFRSPDPNKTVNIQTQEKLNISWYANAPANSGTMSVMYRPEDPNDPNVFAIEPNVPLVSGATMFDPARLVAVDGVIYRLFIQWRPRYLASGDPDIITPGAKLIVGSHPDITLLDPNQSETVGYAGSRRIEWEVRNRVSTQIKAQIKLDRDEIPNNGDEILLPEPNVTLVGGGTWNILYTLDLSVTTIPDGDYYLWLNVTDGSDVLGSYGRDTGKRLVVLKINSRRQLGDNWMGNLGRLVSIGGVPRRTGLTFIGFDFYDNAGSFVQSVNDFDNDGKDDFLVVSQFAKPYRSAPVGDAYLIFGTTRTQLEQGIALFNVSPDPNIAMLNLNSVGTVIRGAILVGPEEVAIPDAPSSGIQAACLMDDLNGDRIGELAFGLPYNHNSQSVRANIPEGGQSTLIARSGQLRRGAVIIANSLNELNQSSTSPLEIVLPLDQIGQHYTDEYLNLEAPTAREVGAGPGQPEFHVVPDPNDPNVTVTVDDHYIDLTYPNRGWSHPFGLDPDLNDMAGPRPVPSLFAPPLGYANDATNEYHWRVPQELGLLVDGNANGSYEDGLNTDRCLFTGYLTGEQLPQTHGSRILGNSQNSQLGSSVTWWRGALVTGSPREDATVGAVSRLACGVAYVSKMKDRISGASSPPWSSVTKPNNLVVAVPGPYNHPTLRSVALTSAIVGAADNAELGPLASLGGPVRVRITEPNTPGDFNGDGLEDLALGSPGMFANAGAAYVFYARLPEPYIFDLAQLNVPSSDPTRRVGVQVNGRPGERLGEVLPTGLDFNGDGYTDAVFGNPHANHGAVDDGEVIVLYGGPQVASTTAGFSIDDIAYGPGLGPGSQDPNKALGVVFQGASGELAGATVASAGDFDGDGVEDLLIAAPYASPQIDIDGDGTDETLTEAGVVYLIYGKRNITNEQGATVKPFTGYINLSEVGTLTVPGARYIGKSPGDHLGGGQTTPDGTTYRNYARSLASAGDVDGDGKTDILIGAVHASPLGQTKAGEVYLIFGK